LHEKSSLSVTLNVSIDAVGKIAGFTAAMMLLLVVKNGTNTEKFSSKKSYQYMGYFRLLRKWLGYACI